MQHESKYKLSGLEFKTNPFPALAIMRRADPVYLVTDMNSQRNTWYITRYQEAEEVLRDHLRFANDYRSTRTPAELAQMPALSQTERLLSQNMHSMDVPDHTRLRALVSKAFSARMIQQLRPRIQSITDELLNKVQDKGEMDLVDEFAAPLSILVISELMGIPVDDRAQLRIWSRTLVDPPKDEEGQQRSKQLLGELVEYLSKLFAARRHSPQEDLLSAIVQAEENGDRLTEEELYSMALLLIFAGFETMVKFISSSILILLQNPAQREQVKANPILLDGAIEELLRMTVPIDRTKLRYATTDTELGGQLIRRGDRVSVLLGSANRDEEKFEAPESLDITRKQNKHLSFGVGIHYCLGAPLARLEGAIAISTLLQRLLNLRLVVPVAALEWDLASFLYGVKHLPVAWDV